MEIWKYWGVVDTNASIYERSMLTYEQGENSKNVRNKVGQYMCRSLHTYAFALVDQAVVAKAEHQWITLIQHENFLHMFRSQRCKNQKCSWPRAITQYPDMACCNALYTRSTSILISLYFCRNIPFKMNVGPHPKSEYRTRYRSVIRSNISEASLGPARCN